MARAQPENPYVSSPWYRFRKGCGPLRIGLLTGSGGASDWLARALRQLCELPEFELSCVFESAGSAAPPQLPFLMERFKRWSDKGHDAFALTQAFDGTVPIKRLQGSGNLAEADRKAIEERKLDVLLYATPAPISGNCERLARWGVWSFFLGDPALPRQELPYWRESGSGPGVSQIHLLAHEQCFERGFAIDCVVTATDDSLRFTANQAKVLRSAGMMVGRRLLNAADGVMPERRGPELTLNASAAARPSILGEMLPFVARRLLKTVVGRVTARGKAIRWFAAIRPAPPSVDFSNITKGAPFKEVPARPGHYFADPILVDHEGRHWLFVEEFSYAKNRANLACMELLGDGRYGELVTILDKPHHLSYPFIIHDRGEFFMIPESSDGGSVELYRAAKFPFEWKLEKVFIENTRLVDTTPFHHEGKWYFFTSTSASLEEEQGYLFMADSLDGDWEYHPANPIATDTRALRGAGPIVKVDGRMIRPTQDCSEFYGYAVTFMEIVRLSPTEFEERRVGGLLPTWAPELYGTHTYGVSSRYEVIDGQRFTRQR